MSALKGVNMPNELKENKGEGEGEEQTDGDVKTAEAVKKGR